MSTFISAYWQADFFGKLIFLGLFALSVICWAFLIHKTWLLSQVKRNSKMFQTFVEKNRNSLLNLSVDQFPKCSIKEIPHPFAHIYATIKQKAMELLDKNNFYLEGKSEHNYLSRTDIELIENSLDSMIVVQKENLEKNFFVLSTIVTLAPFLGLLGTVWGILITFSGLQGGASISSNAAVLSGLSTALTTTVIGLLIAIPALIANNYLKSASRRFATEMYDFSNFLLSTVEIQYRKVDIS